MGHLTAGFKVFIFLILCLITIPLQAFGAFIFRNSSLFYIVPTFFYRSICLIFNIKVAVKGEQASGHVIYVGNHLSYIDIAVIGANLKATFISKADVKNWPILGLLATLGKTVFIERSRNAAAKCIQDIKATMESGRNLVLFPEGTSTNGMDVLPFKSTIFDLFLDQELKEKLSVQPFTLTLQSINGHAALTAKDHDIYAWHGDMEFFPHLWQLAHSREAQILLTFHPPYTASNFNDRKEFARVCHEDVVNGLKNTLPAALDFTPEAP